MTSEIRSVRSLAEKTHFWYKTSKTSILFRKCHYLKYETPVVKGLNFELAAPYAKNITETRFRRFPDAKISF